MKTFKSLIALAVVASITCNVLTAHAYPAPEVATGASIDGGTLSIQVTMLANNQAAPILVSLRSPMIDAQGKIDRAWLAAHPEFAQLVTLPASAPFTRLQAATSLNAHNQWVFVVTDVDHSNQVKLFYVK